MHPTENATRRPERPTYRSIATIFDATVRELEAKGVEFTQAPEDHGYGFVTYFKVPGGFNVQLYQPKYAK